MTHIQWCNFSLNTGVSFWLSPEAFQHISYIDQNSIPTNFELRRTAWPEEKSVATKFARLFGIEYVLSQVVYTRKSLNRSMSTGATQKTVPKKREQVSIQWRKKQPFKCIYFFCSLNSYTRGHSLSPIFFFFSIPLISNLAFFSTSSSIPNSNNLGVLIDNNVSLPFFRFLSNHVAYSFPYL